MSLAFRMRRVLLAASVLLSPSPGSRPASALDRPPACLDLVPSFDAASFRDPESVLWPGYFWLWNSPLEPDLLRAQLRDMASHGAKSVCMLPMPHAFRPDSTNNSMAPDYLAPEFFDRVKLAVDEAAALGMNWWLYDEGGWPSGQALGKVVQDHPELAAQRVERRQVASTQPYVVPADALALVTDPPGSKIIASGATWTPEPGGQSAWLYTVASSSRPDLLNPLTTRRFIELTHEQYRRAIGDHFGKTVRFAFTDEPAVFPPASANSIPWTAQLEALYRQRFGGTLIDLLPALFATPSADMTASQAGARVSFFDLWTLQFQRAYFGELRDFCRQDGLASGGHLGGEDRTDGAVVHGFGQAMRQLRATDVPGVDLIWRQLFPGRPNQHHFPKLASSVAHQNGTRFAFSESFAVYGNGLTPAQMKWLVDYQYLRGINLLVCGCYPLSTRDHQMMGERPHFGAVNPFWDHLPGFHAYVARMGYLMSIGKPRISVGLYYPARDMWAWGTRATAAIESHDQMAGELLARHCDFDLIDDDLLTDPSTHVRQGELVAGAMSYSTIVCGDVSWMKPEALACLKRFASAGGTVLCVNHAPGTDGAPGVNEPAFCQTGTPAGLAARVMPIADLNPQSPDIRVAGRTLLEGEVVMLFNEGAAAFDGTVGVNTACVYRLDPDTGDIEEIARERGRSRIRLEPGQTAALLLTDRAREAHRPRRATGEIITLDAQTVARPTRRFVVGEHDYEVQKPETPAVPFRQATVWKEWLGEDYSGEVDYEASFEVPESWSGDPLRLEVADVEYGATVTLDGKTVGHMLWPPWRIDLPACTAGRHTLVIDVANTLSNELTSARVEKLWSAKRGAGWPSPYHARAIAFERESRGGALRGPILLKRMELAPPGGKP